MRTALLQAAHRGCNTRVPQETFDIDITDPRTWPAADAADALATRLHRFAGDAVAAGTRHEADALDAAAKALLREALGDPRSARIGAALASAPSLDVSRHLWRLLVDIEGQAAQEGPAAALFAVPIVLVAALETREVAVTLSGALSNRDALAALLREGRGLGGVETFALSNALVGVDAIDVAAWPQLRARIAHGAEGTPLDLPPAPIDVRERGERVHLRFIPGALLASRPARPFAEANIGAWGMPFAQALSRELRVPGVALLALPRAPQPLLSAVQSGRAAQRDVSAQVFASNAIRRLRASFGEPTAIISAHRVQLAPGGGELRLSLSSALSPKHAEGFRCPLYPYEAAVDVAGALAALMRDCRVADVRVVPGVHADTDPVTGGPMFFKSAGAYAPH